MCSVFQLAFSDIFEVLIAYDFDTALEIAQSNNLDFIVTDMRLQGEVECQQDGVDLIRKIREFGIKTPAAVMSAYISQEKSREIKELGIEYVWEKPFDILKLREEVVKFLN